MQESDIEPHFEWATRKTEEKRRLAYSDPLTGSDPLFAQATRMDAMGEAGADVIRQQAVERYNEIKASMPWPQPVLE